MRANHPTSLRILRNVNNLSLNYSHSIASILIFNEFLLQPYECSCYPQSQMVTEQITFLILILLILQYLRIITLCTVIGHSTIWHVCFNSTLYKHEHYVEHVSTNYCYSD